MPERSGKMLVGNEKKPVWNQEILVKDEKMLVGNGKILIEDEQEHHTIPIRVYTGALLK